MGSFDKNIYTSRQEKCIVTDALPREDVFNDRFFVKYRQTSCQLLLHVKDRTSFVKKKSKLKYSETGSFAQNVYVSRQDNIEVIYTTERKRLKRRVCPTNSTNLQTNFANYIQILIMLKHLSKGRCPMGNCPREVVVRGSICLRG